MMGRQFWCDSMEGLEWGWSACNLFFLQSVPYFPLYLYLYFFCICTSLNIPVVKLYPKNGICSCIKSSCIPRHWMAKLCFSVQCPPPSLALLCCARTVYCSQLDGALYFCSFLFGHNSHFFDSCIALCETSITHCARCSRCAIVKGVQLWKVCNCERCARCKLPPQFD